MPKRVIDKPYNGGTWTRARFFGFLRSGLRRMSLRWGPKAACLRASRRAYVGRNKRRKWDYQCDECGGWYDGKSVAAHHKIDCGELRSYADLPGFAERMFCEKDGFRVLCKACHTATHKKEGADAA